MKNYWHSRDDRADNYVSFPLLELIYIKMYTAVLIDTAFLKLSSIQQIIS